MEDFKDIVTKNNGTVSVQHLKGYRQIGQGGDGTIYQLTSERCVKIFYEEETQQRELEALQVGQLSSVIPRLYEYGSNYIVMEYVNGTSLKKIAKKERQLSESIVRKILFMLEEMKRVGFARHDTEVRHILFNEQGEIKVIDHKRALTSARTVPTKLVAGLKKMGVLKEFLEHVNKLCPSLYEEWKHI
ncbi:protein kinase-like protein [Aneurinibacillus soli]|uniref:Serine/threonine-protein kinase D n=1 Tax=Aneurinibacillus soli TaxID=1500254 RepID=A0A0U5B4G6_9BACL|nr:AarF/UbiB family protein [Aneurinibacillus soli]PYE64354.1 protein kinase-like protein [Aneurinibacillus soli]BAU28303.1 Serine/threonine-protein kinase D [Aneurinibacillus soli]